jgi:D-glycero-alpha-D-manno-heptose-7-phosphate kinase
MKNNMVIVKSPFRISFFGGSTDYESHYKEYGSFIIGTTIDKYVYLSMRLRPKILPDESVVVYSKLENVKNISDIHQPLIRETLKYCNINQPIEFNSFSDIPSRTGLGGSSSYCVGLLYLIYKILKKDINKRKLAQDAINIERHILKEAGGIQDSIWPAYGGLNSIEINTNGDFFVKPLPVTEDFKKELENSVVLIYTNEQRNQDEIARSHENKNKEGLLKLSKESYQYFLKEDIKNIGRLFFETWNEKSKLSSLISNGRIDEMMNQAMSMGAYGSKLLGSGGCGFIAVICDPSVGKKIKETFRDNTFDIKFESDGVSQIYPKEL